MISLLLFIFASTATETAHAFGTPRKVRLSTIAHVPPLCTVEERIRASTALRAKKKPEEIGPFARNNARTCVRRFLTQRSVQSFMFLQTQCRDPHTVRWLDNYGNTTDLLQYHGSGAFNTSIFEDWDSYLLDMMDRPVDVVIIEARRRGRGIGGWSKNNPYLQERVVEFEIEIDPPSLASRIISVREQIAREWTADLDIVITTGEEMIESYFENVLKERDDEDIGSGDGPDIPEDDGVDNENLVGNATTAGDEAADIQFSPGDSQKAATFDRNGMFFLRQSIAFDEQSSSPLRKGSFDLLVLLATQESVHRVLRELQSAGPEKEVVYDWFRNYYIKRAPSFFDGPQKLGRADDFLEELILTPPSMIKEGAYTSIIDPVGLVDKIVRTRSDVAKEWKEAMAEVPNDHIALRKKLLAHQMKKTLLVVEDERIEVEIDLPEEREIGDFE